MGKCFPGRRQTLRQSPVDVCRRIAQRARQSRASPPERQEVSAPLSASRPARYAGAQKCAGFVEPRRFRFTERRRSRTYRAVGYTTAPVLKTAFGLAKTPASAADSFQPGGACASLCAGNSDDVDHIDATGVLPPDVRLWRDLDTSQLSAPARPPVARPRGAGSPRQVRRLPSTAQTRVTAAAMRKAPRTPTDWPRTPPNAEPSPAAATARPSRTPKTLARASSEVVCCTIVYAATSTTTPPPAATVRRSSAGVVAGQSPTSPRDSPRSKARATAPPATPRRQELRSTLQLRPRRCQARSTARPTTSTMNDPECRRYRRP
jgi:hypothetical protein